MIFGKQLCQSYQKLAQLSRTYFVFFRNPSTAAKFNFQWHASFWFLEIFLEISIFLFAVWPLCQSDRAKHFFRFGKKSNFPWFFLSYGEARTSLTFFKKQNNIQLGPLWKMMTNQNFHCLPNPLFFAWESILQNQSIHSQ